MFVRFIFFVMFFAYSSVVHANIDCSDVPATKTESSQMTFEGINYLLVKTTGMAACQLFESLSETTTVVFTQCRNASNNFYRLESKQFVCKKNLLKEYVCETAISLKTGRNYATTSYSICPDLDGEGVIGVRNGDSETLQ